MIVCKNPVVFAWYLNVCCWMQVYSDQHKNTTLFNLEIIFFCINIKKNINQLLQDLYHKIIWIYFSIFIIPKKLYDCAES